MPPKAAAVWNYPNNSLPPLVPPETRTAMVENRIIWRTSLAHTHPANFRGRLHSSSYARSHHRCYIASDSNTKATLDVCLTRLHYFLQAPNKSANDIVPSPVTPATAIHHAPLSTPTKDRPSSDTGIDLVGWSFPDRSLGQCTILATGTYLEGDGTLHNTLKYSSQIGHTPNSHVSKISEVRSWLDQMQRQQTSATARQSLLHLL